MISGAVEQVLPRVSSIVFLDAHMPDDGTRGLDNTSEFSRKGILATFDRYLGVCKADQIWRTFEFPCGHDIMVDMPERLAIEVA